MLEKNVWKSGKLGRCNRYANSTDFLDMLHYRLSHALLTRVNRSPLGDVCISYDFLLESMQSNRQNVEMVINPLDMSLHFCLKKYNSTRVRNFEWSGQQNPGFFKCLLYLYYLYINWNHLPSNFSAVHPLPRSIWNFRNTYYNNFFPGQLMSIQILSFEFKASSLYHLLHTLAYSIWLVT